MKRWGVVAARSSFARWRDVAVRLGKEEAARTKANAEAQKRELVDRIKLLEEAHEVAAEEWEAMTQAALAAASEEHRETLRRWTEERDDREQNLLDAEKANLSDRHAAELEYVEALRLGADRAKAARNVVGRWANRTLAVGFATWRARAKRLLKAPKYRSPTLLPRLMRSAAARLTRRGLARSWATWRANAAVLSRQNDNLQTGVRRLRRRLALWARAGEAAAFRTWRANAMLRRQQLMIAVGRIVQAARRRARWRCRYAWTRWASRVGDTAAGATKIMCMLRRFVSAQLIGAFRQWHDHFIFMGELHRALASSLLRHKQQLLDRRPVERPQALEDAVHKVKQLERALASSTADADQRVAAMEEALATLKVERDTLRRRLRIALAGHDAGPPPPPTPPRSTPRRTRAFVSRFDVMAARSLPGDRADASEPPRTPPRTPPLARARKKSNLQALGGVGLQ